MKWIVLVCVAASTAVAQSCPDLWKTGKRAEARACWTKLTRAANPAVRAEALWALREWQDSNEAFKAAVAAQPQNADVHVRYGRMLLDHAQPTDAKAEFSIALKLKADHPGALLGMALVAAENYDRQATELAQLALKSDPKLVEAQELLARLALEDSDEKKATEEANKALGMSPTAFDAMGVLGAIDVLANKGGSPWFEKVAAANATYGQAYAIAAGILVLNRRYEEGIELYRKALAADPDLQSARSALGINLMRLGQEKEAYQMLEAAFNAGYQSSATTNTLKLMDSYKRFQTFTTPRTVVKLDRKEADLLRPYVEGELKRAIATYEKKYGIKLDKPVQVEVYPNHEDFAVRTMGMPGLGALGVTFGNVVAMDSPSGRQPGAFHWASTLWHELSHVYVLAATKHRVPRWFTEGMAVHEETAISPDWGDRLDPAVIQAIKGGKLLPIAQLDRGFVRPSYPSQVVVSYFQAGKICDYINEKWGYSKLLEMMHAFAESKPTPEVVEAKLGMKPEDFDKQFLAWLDNKVGTTVKGYDEWRKTMKELAAAAQSGKHDEVIKSSVSAVKVYPEYVERNSAYELSAAAFEAKGDRKNALKHLELYSKAGGRDPATLTKLAKWQKEDGRPADAVRTLERLTFVYPLGEQLHATLGDLYSETGNHEGAIREYTAAVYSGGIDQAGARYNLARALLNAKRTEEAKEQLLLSLEAAPGFKPAQRMLLELSR